MNYTLFKLTLIPLASIYLFGCGSKSDIPAGPSGPFDGTYDCVPTQFVGESCTLFGASVPWTLSVSGSTASIDVVASTALGPVPDGGIQMVPCSQGMATAAAYTCMYTGVDAQDSTCTLTLTATDAGPFRVNLFGGTTASCTRR